MGRSTDRCGNLFERREQCLSVPRKELNVIAGSGVRVEPDRVRDDKRNSLGFRFANGLRRCSATLGPMSTAPKGRAAGLANTMAPFTVSVTTSVRHAQCRHQPKCQEDIVQV
jgi:hypothetical protein